MIRRMQRLAVLAMTVCLILGTMAVSVFADYEYDMKVSAGRGQIEGKQSVDCATAEAVTTDPAANVIKIDGNELKVTPPDPDHFVIGLKDAGHDNSQILTGEVTLAGRNEDTELIVAYGLKSDMVRYTVRYVNRAGAALLASETHYGVDGSKPVVAYKYVDGYLPYAYNLTGTITKGGANEFVFYYDEVNVEGNVVTVVDNNGGGAANAGAGGAGGAAGGAGGAAGGAAGAGGAGGAAGAGAGGANIGDGATPAAQPADLVDIDNGETPTTDNPDGTSGDGTDAASIDENKTPKANWGVIGGGAAAVVAIAAAALAIAKRRRKEDEE